MKKITVSKRITENKEIICKWIGGKYDYFGKYIRPAKISKSQENNGDSGESWKQLQIGEYEGRTLKK